ncbi:MAG: CpsB/CapC family capsule biosynthesis tyrosine phosphatase [Dehalococcoidia bacterium]
MAWIDIHCHVLPAIDDGPESMDDSVAMARAAAEDGTGVIVATPHQRDVMLNASVEKVRELAADLDARMQRETTQGVPRVRILVGMENHIEPDLPDWVDQGIALPINGTRLILAEPPFTAYPRYVGEVLARLQMKRLIPVLAHPERNAEFQRHPGKLKELVERGMLVQVSAGSFTGAFGSTARRAAVTLMRRRLVHVVASDMHRVRGPRSPQLGAAFRRVARLAGERQARLLFETNPALILEGHVPEEYSVAGDDRRRWWIPRLPAIIRRSSS